MHYNLDDETENPVPSKRLPAYSKNMGHQTINCSSAEVEKRSLQITSRYERARLPKSRTRTTA